MRNTAMLLLGLVAFPMKAALAQAAETVPAESQATAPVIAPPTTVSVPASEAIAVPAPTTAPAVADAQGKIIMYRGSGIMGMGIACPIRYQGKEIVELARGKYAEWPVKAGHYVLTNRTSSVDVTVDPGETRYVRCMIKPGFLTGRADLQVVDEASFNEHSNEFEKKAIE